MATLFNERSWKTNAPTTIYEDNQGAIKLAKNVKYHIRTKHTDIYYHFVYQLFLMKSE